MGYNIEIKGSGSVSTLVEELQRVIESLEEHPEEEVSYRSSNDMEVDIIPNDDEDDEDDEDDFGC